MALEDLQSIAAAAAALLAAAGGAAAGIYTGRNNRKKDQADSLKQLEESRLARDRMEEDISTKRFEQIAQDAAAARLLLRERELDYDRRSMIMRAERDRWWDLSRIHWNLVGSLVHILSNVFQTLPEMGGSANVSEAEANERVVKTVRNAYKRFQDLKIPTSLEEPIPAAVVPPTSKP